MDVTGHRASGARRGYRAHLDGVRGVAILLVVGFHSGVARLSGGFVGVDVFFVLSGYLVTGVLLAELGSDGGLRLRRFYGARVRRLLPMALLVLTVTALVYGLTAAPALAVEAVDSFRAAYLYVANWQFIRESQTYLGSDVEASPIIHYWSLSIEEQFYLVWPVLLLAAASLRHRIGRHWPTVLAGVTAAVGLGSLALAHHLGQTDVDRAYFGTDTRAYQLLAGATIALLPALGGRRVRRLTPFLGIAGLVVIVALATLFSSLSPITRGTGAVVGAVALLLALEGEGSSGLQRACSARPLVAIGVLSYSVYLWHLPLIYLLHTWFDPRPALTLALALPGSLALAWVSGRLLETPVRRSAALDRLPVRVAAVGLALSVIGAVLVAPALLDTGTVTAPAAALDWKAATSDAARSPDCRGEDVSVCTVREGDGLNVVLVGDSLVRVWQSAFEVIAEERDMTLSVLWLGGCSWHRDVQVAVKVERQQECYAAQADWFDRAIPELDPDLVVLTHRATFDPARPFLADLDLFLEATDATVGALRDDGRQVAILEPLPISAEEDDPLVCLSRGTPAEDCAFSATPTPTPLEEHYRELDAEGEVTSVDADRIMCPALPRCDAADGDVVVMRDGTHMTATAARQRAGRLEDLLVARGVLDP